MCFFLVFWSRTTSRIDMRRNEAATTFEGFRQIKIKSLHFWFLQRTIPYFDDATEKCLKSSIFGRSKFFDLVFSFYFGGQWCRFSQFCVTYFSYMFVWRTIKVCHFFTHFRIEWMMSLNHKCEKEQANSYGWWVRGSGQTHQFEHIHTHKLIQTILCAKTRIDRQTHQHTLIQFAFKRKRETKFGGSQKFTFFYENEKRQRFVRQQKKREKMPSQYRQLSK